jgi:hypothetical protein
MAAATRIYYFTVTIPAGTDITAPFTQDVSFPPASVVTVRWRVPPGPSGFMGWRLGSDGAPVIPAQPGTYIISDDESATWDIAGYQDSGSWEVTGYNNDAFDHSVYLEFLTVPPGQDQAQAVTPPPLQADIPNADLSSPPPDIADFVAGIQVQT